MEGIQNTTLKNNKQTIDNNDQTTDSEIETNGGTETEEDKEPKTEESGDLEQAKEGLEDDDAPQSKGRCSSLWLKVREYLTFERYSWVPQAAILLVMFVALMFVSGACFYVTENFGYLDGIYLSLTTMYNLGM
jgi:hypothetical protein